MLTAHDLNSPPRRTITTETYPEDAFAHLEPGSVIDTDEDFRKHLMSLSDTDIEIMAGLAPDRREPNPDETEEFLESLQKLSF